MSENLKATLIISMLILIGWTVAQYIWAGVILGIILLAPIIMIVNKEN